MRMMSPLTPPQRRRRRASVRAGWSSGQVVDHWLQRHATSSAAKATNRLRDNDRWIFGFPSILPIRRSSSRYVTFPWPEEVFCVNDANLWAERIETLSADISVRGSQALLLLGVSFSAVLGTIMATLLSGPTWGALGVLAICLGITMMVGPQAAQIFAVAPAWERRAELMRRRADVLHLESLIRISCANARPRGRHSLRRLRSTFLSRKARG